MSLIKRRDFLKSSLVAPMVAAGLGPSLSFAQDPYGLRSKKELQSVGSVLGMDTTQSKQGVESLHSWLKTRAFINK